MNTFKQIIFLFWFMLPLFSFAQVNVSTHILQSSVEMIWESHSYVPPLYRGKSLYPVAGSATILALPSVQLGSPEKLVYTWKKDGIVDGSQSGVGKQSFVFSGSQFGGSPLIVVEVSNGTRTEFGAIRITETRPFVLFYENSPLNGITFTSALPRNITKKGSSVDLELYPFFFSASSRADTHLSYTWSANGIPLDSARGASLSAITEEPRPVTLQASVSNTRQILQQASAALTISFE